MDDAYYLQDSRGYVGNDILWWRLGGGYTTDVSKAEVFSRDEAFRKNANRDTDKPWPKAYIDARIRPVVDMQDASLQDALGPEGYLQLHKRPPAERDTYRCHQCSVFLSPTQYYTSPCPCCGSRNHP